MNYVYPGVYVKEELRHVQDQEKRTFLPCKRSIRDTSYEILQAKNQSVLSVERKELTYTPFYISFI